jgi:hypothetical protein
MNAECGLRIAERALDLIHSAIRIPRFHDVILPEYKPKRRSAKAERLF